MNSVTHVGVARYPYTQAINNYSLQRAYISRTPVGGKLQQVFCLYYTSGLVHRRGYDTCVNRNSAFPSSDKPQNRTQSSYSIKYSEYGPLRAFTSEAFGSHVPSKYSDIVKTPIVLLFVTPSLTRFLEIGNPAIPNLLRKSFCRPLPVQEVDVLAAVVDRIPFPIENVRKDTGIGREEAPYGSEGISVLIADSQQTAPDLWPPETSDSCESILDEREVRFLSFKFSSKDAWDASQDSKKPEAVYTIDLPLASTIFQNGNPSTMVAQRWWFNSDTESSTDLICRKHTPLQQQNLFMSHNELGLEPSISMPLFQKLTAPRTISESMGNIVRRLRVSHVSSDTMPASEELEKTLSAWTPNKVNAHEIWARLTPRERWSGLPQIPEEPAEVDRGSRLHKVLSGGGGWGNKKGLISLDPISRFRNSFVQSMFVEEENIGRENHDVLDHIARPGDSIQFFAFERTSSPQSTESPKTMKIHSPHTIRIGNTTSRQDAMPNAIANESSDPERLIAYGHFGALCESGIVLDIQLCLENATSYGNQAMGTVVQTKLPPLSSFCWRAKTVPNVSS